MAKLENIQFIGHQDIKERHASYLLSDEGRKFLVTLNGSVHFWTSEDVDIRQALNNAK